MITSLGPNDWESSIMVDGILQETRKTSFSLRSGEWLITGLSNDDNLNSYSPGRWLFANPDHMPITQGYIYAYLGTGGFGSTYARDTYSTSAPDSILLQGSQVSVKNYSLTRSFSSDGLNYTLSQSFQRSVSDQIGLIREIVSYRSGDTVDYELQSYLAEGEQEIQLENTSYKSTFSPFVMDISSAGNSVKEDELKEVYRLASELPPFNNSITTTLGLAQAYVAYTYYYLYASELPSELAAQSNLQDFVTNLQTNDPFTFTLPPEQLSRFNEISSESGATIGLLLGTISADAISSSNPLSVIEVAPFSRAWFDGFKANDQLLEVDGTSILGKTLPEVMAILPNREASPVTLTVSRSGNTLDIDTAAEIFISRLINSNTAYINIRQFTDNTGNSVLSDYTQLAQGNTITQLILDLRANGGGKLIGALDLVDWLIDDDSPAGTQLIYSTHDGLQHSYLGERTSLNLQGIHSSNLIVLVDDHSASASELTASVLQYYHRATIIGDTTYGKGVSQILVSLFDEWGVAITHQRLLDPGGNSWHGIGIVPDISGGLAPESPDNDPGLTIALNLLNGVSKASPLKNKRQGGPDPLKKMMEVNFR